MLFKQEILERIARGEVTLAFRRWRRPTVKAGGRLRTPVGELAIATVSEVEPGAITDAEARQAGFTDRAALIASLGDRDGKVYRIAFRLAGPDRRIALRADDAIDAAEFDQISVRLARLDRGGPWTGDVLKLIRAHPARRAADLATLCGQDTLHFKRRVRQLKELGLTESLEVGYRLSPRGEHFAARLLAE